MSKERLPAPPNKEPEPPIASHYSWLEANRFPMFPRWEDEILYAEARGYILVPPKYHVPHFTTAAVMKDLLPKLYVMRKAGEFDECKTPLDRPALGIGYPLYFRRPEQAKASEQAAVKPAEFRLLRNQEDIIQPDDEFLLDDCQSWVRAGDEALRWMIGKPYSTTFFQPMRRKIAEGK